MYLNVHILFVIKSPENSSFSYMPQQIMFVQRSVVFLEFSYLDHEFSVNNQRLQA